MPGRNVALYSRVVTASRSEVVEVPLDGTAAPHVLDVGYAVDATDDGARIAVVRRRLREGGGSTIELEARTDGQVLATWTTRSTDELPAEPANPARHCLCARRALCCPPPATHPRARSAGETTDRVCGGSCF